MLFCDFIDGVVVESGGCWSHGSLRPGSRDGYRRLNNTYAHRMIYKNLIKPIPAGLVIDHLCRNPGCLNPGHMEPVEIRENVLRGEGPTAKNARKAHCKHGHSLDDAYVSARGKRTCRICHRAKVHTYYFQNRDKRREQMAEWWAKNRSGRQLAEIQGGGETE